MNSSLKVQGRLRRILPIPYGTLVEGQSVDITLVQHIEVREDCRAYIVGTQKHPELMAAMYVYGEISIEEVADHYDISPADVHAALMYFYDNQAQNRATVC